jgi:hypothetical protein
METVQQILAQKQVILRYAPQSGGNVNGKDVVFLMKEPGTDALVFDNGTYITRNGFGDRKRLNQSKSYTDVIKKLGTSGYKPYNYFAPGVREQYESQHKAAEEKKLNAQRTFPTVEKLNLRQLPSRLGYDQVSIGQPQMEMQRTVTRTSPMQRGKFVDEQYRRMFESDIANIEKIITPTPRIKQPPTNSIFAPHEFAMWASKEYSDVKKRNAELGIGAPLYTPLQEAKKKLREMEKQIKRKKAGDKNADKSKE